MFAGFFVLPCHDFASLFRRGSVTYTCSIPLYSILLQPVISIANSQRNALPVANYRLPRLPC